MIDQQRQVASTHDLVAAALAAIEAGQRER